MSKWKDIAVPPGDVQLPMCPASYYAAFKSWVDCGALHHRQLLHIMTDGAYGAAAPPTFWEAVVFYGHGFGRP